MIFLKIIWKNTIFLIVEPFEKWIVQIVFEASISPRILLNEALLDLENISKTIRKQNKLKLLKVRRVVEAFNEMILNLMRWFSIREIHFLVKNIQSG